MTGCMSGLNHYPDTMMCDGLEQLKGEHPPLLEMLDGLVTLAKRIEQDQREEDFSALRKAVEKFLSRLEPHSEREEGVLFEMMASYIGREMGPIAVMEYEHDQAKRLISTFLHNTKDGTSGFTVQKMNENAQLIIHANDTLVSHFAKEENILFPMAENMLSADEKLELAEKIKMN